MNIQSFLPVSVQADTFLNAVHLVAPELPREAEVWIRCGTDASHVEVQLALSSDAQASVVMPLHSPGPIITETVRWAARSAEWKRRRASEVAGAARWGCVGRPAGNVARA